MRLRTIGYPQAFDWALPVMSPVEVSVAGSAKDLLSLAQSSADELIAAAKDSAQEIRLAEREAFLTQYSNDFRSALGDFVSVRQQLEAGVGRYADEVVRTALKRLGLVLTSDQKLQAVLDQVVAETLPDMNVTLRVAPDFTDRVGEALISKGHNPSRFTVQADASLTGDEIILLAPRGSQVSCSFDQLLNQLLFCL